MIMRGASWVGDAKSGQHIREGKGQGEEVSIEKTNGISGELDTILTRDPPTSAFRN